jgi:hypothetical protein
MTALGIVAPAACKFEIILVLAPTRKRHDMINLYAEFAHLQSMGFQYIHELWERRRGRPPEQEVVDLALEKLPHLRSQLSVTRIEKFSIS